MLRSDNEDSVPPLYEPSDVFSAMLECIKDRPELQSIRTIIVASQARPEFVSAKDFTLNNLVLTCLLRPSYT